ncbi:9898_t:CDS:2 [Ambispora gerdemannii]|uniref:Signal recognition particle receptor subunit beta n=1 Tax=Ambispora gerdemannii TaxID=144530 RepID=A0A9N9FCY2_9GLOM|nr:9898_t:CDS:2 [Ambispora gerdemannii]
MKENEAYITPTIEIIDEIEPLTKKPVHIVDLPGHEKLRFKFTEFAPIVRGIIFLIDSATCSKNYRQISEYLYDIFSNKDIAKKKVSVLIACNKNDLLTALPPEKIQASLQNEINRLRATRTAALEHQDSLSEDAEYLGYENEDFKFEHLENRVEFVSCSVENDKVKHLKEWIADVYSGY